MSRFSPTSIPNAGGADLNFNAPLTPQPGVNAPRNSVSTTINQLAQSLGIAVNIKAQSDIKEKQLDAEEQKLVDEQARENYFSLTQRYNDIRAEYNDAVANGNEERAAELRATFKKEVPLLDTRLNSIIKDTGISYGIRAQAEQFLSGVYDTNSNIITQYRQQQEKRADLEQRNLFQEQFDFALADINDPTFSRAVAGVVQELDGSSTVKTLYTLFENRMRKSLETGDLTNEQINQLFEDPEYKKQLRANVTAYYNKLQVIQADALEEALDLEAIETQNLVVSSGIGSVVESLTIDSLSDPVQFAYDNIDTFVSLGYADDNEDAQNQIMSGIITSVNRIQASGSGLLIAPEKLEQLIPLANTTGDVDSLNRTIRAAYERRQQWAAETNQLPEYNASVRQDILSRYNGNEDLIPKGSKDRFVYDMHPVIMDRQKVAFVSNIDGLISDETRLALNSDQVSFEDQKVLLSIDSAIAANEITLANGRLNDKAVDLVKQGLMSTDPASYEVAKSLLASLGPDWKELVLDSFSDEDRIFAELSYNIPMTEEDLVDPTQRIALLRSYAERATGLVSSSKMSEAIKKVYDVKDARDITNNPTTRQALILFIAQQYEETGEGALVPLTDTQVKQLVNNFKAGLSINASNGTLVRHDQESDSKAFKSRYAYRTRRNSPVPTQYEDVDEFFSSARKEFYPTAKEVGNSYRFAKYGYDPEEQGPTLLAWNLWTRTNIISYLPPQLQTDEDKKSFVYSIASSMLEKDTPLFMYGEGGRAFTFEQDGSVYQYKFTKEEWDLIKDGWLGLQPNSKYREISDRYYNSLQLKDN